MSKYNAGDRVKIVLKKPYTEDEIKGYGCHPAVDGKYAKVEYVEINGSYHLLLEVPLKPHELHKDTDFTEEFSEYIEEESSLELA